MRFLNGTRVPWNTGVPPRIFGSLWTEDSGADIRSLLIKFYPICRPTTGIAPRRAVLMSRARTWPFQGQNTGSNPVGDAILIRGWKHRLHIIPKTSVALSGRAGSRSVRGRQISSSKYLNCCVLTADDPGANNLENRTGGFRAPSPVGPGF